MNANFFTLLLGGALLVSASGCGDSHKIPSGAPKGDSDPVSIDMGGGTETGKDSPPPASETPPTTDAAAPSDSPAPPAEKAPTPPAEK